MVTNDATEELPADFRLDQAVLDYLRAGETGPPPDHEEWLRLHPELTAELRAFLADLDHVQQIVRPLVDPVPRTWTDAANTVQLDGDAPPPAVDPIRNMAFGDYELL